MCVDAFVAKEFRPFKIMVFEIELKFLFKIKHNDTLRASGIKREKA